MIVALADLIEEQRISNTVQNTSKIYKLRLECLHRIKEVEAHYNKRFLDMVDDIKDKKVLDSLTIVIPYL